LGKEPLKMVYTAEEINKEKEIFNAFKSTL